MEAHTDQAFLRSASRCVVLADSSKVGLVTFAAICPLTDIHDLVTDDGLTGAQEKAVTGCGVRVLRA